MPTEIVTEVYDITCLKRDGNRFRAFFRSDETPTLFDTGFEETTDSVIDAITEVGVDPERIVITHGDDDHIGGFDTIANKYDAETWVPEQTVEELDVEPDYRYGDGDQIGPYTAVHTPGHEPDHHSLIDDDAGIAVLGDAVSGADRYGLPDGYFHLPPAHHSQNLIQAKESLETLVEFSFDVGLVYHGASVTENASSVLESYVNYAGKPE
ncbi:MBL fold metallo-hydrolase [Halosimplex pelagicum]|uniref:MBL fold metallo-hydrolase n=1 Tax=Halosimplex pelagicum TaxID=869886 RepID=A0A7D5TB74_9EURY|nr:MBL fold metallo-hydrolase [Halosimplex pelagicum]QLH82033.1 MBL fold metallo-hydrolase [Halosimplex pelagicum]